MSGLSLGVLGAATTSATALGNLILVSPQKTVGYQPKNQPNADGSPNTAAQQPAFLFNYEGEQTASIDSDITDHYIEDNTALQDQIALHPPIITTHGYIGELNNVFPFPAYAAGVSTVLNKLAVVSAYTPALSVTALQAYNTAFQLYQVAANVRNSAIAAWSSVSGTGGENVISGNFNTPVTTLKGQTNQQIAFQQLYGYWAQRYLFTVQTPWAIFDNMAIKSLRAIQDADTNMISDFEVSFKQVRIASTSVSLGGTLGGSLAPICSAQAAPATNLGNSTPPATNVNFTSAAGK